MNIAFGIRWVYLGFASAKSAFGRSTLSPEEISEMHWLGPCTGRRIIATYDI